MKHIIKSLLICVWTVMLLPSQAFPESLQMVTLQYYPYQYDEEGQLKGFVAAIVEEAFRRIEQPINIKVYPFARAMKMIQNGDADAVFTAAKNPERELFADFATEVLIDQTMSLFVRADSPLSFDGDLSKLHQYRFGVIYGFRYGNVFDNAVKTGMLSNINKTNSAESNARMLASGRLDFWMSNREQALFAINKLRLSDAIKELKPAVQTIPTYLAFSRKRNLEDVKHRFDAELRKMKADGSFQGIISDYWNMLRRESATGNVPGH